MAEISISRRVPKSIAAGRRMGQADPTADAAKLRHCPRSRTVVTMGRRTAFAQRLHQITLPRHLRVMKAALQRGLGRLLAWRRRRPAGLALPPVNGVADIAAMLDAVTAAVRRGRITPGEAAALSTVAEAYLRALETREFDRRLRALEAARQGAVP